MSNENMLTAYNVKTKEKMFPSLMQLSAKQQKVDTSPKEMTAKATSLQPFLVKQKHLLPSKLEQLSRVGSIQLHIFFKTGPWPVFFIWSCTGFFAAIPSPSPYGLPVK